MKVKLFYTARIYTPLDPGRPLKGGQQGRLQHWDRGALLCRNGLIQKIGPEKDVLKALPPGGADFDLDCQGLCLTPGFVDPHTHICFAATREEEFSLRLQGVPYLEILKRGGGILASVQAVRAASEDQLFSATRPRINSALSLGTTAIEIKSGYGLDLENELKMLRVIGRLRRETPLDVAATFLGAHAVPEEYRRQPE
ncbi:MAG: imidazolonepropionase, partial [Deltaproteobacteria bacterium]|nr:imidazolonepropionase [Deltaproteobacteria bacterium]